MCTRTLLESANKSLSPPGSARFTVPGVAFAIYFDCQSHRSVVASPLLLCWPTLVRLPNRAPPLCHIDINSLVLSDTITYGTTKLGIIRAECVAFTVSPRNSAAGVAHLINKTGTQHIVITSDLKSLMDTTIAILKEQGSTIPEVQLMPTFEDLFPDDDSGDFKYLPEPKPNGPDDPVCILHSSGM